MVAVLSSYPLGATAQPPAPSLQEVAAAVTEKSREYIAAASRYQPEERGETWISSAPGEKSPSLVRGRHRGSSGLMVVTSGVGKDEDGRVTGINSKYSFELKRSAGRPWVLADYQPVGAEPKEVFPLLGTADPITQGIAPYWLEEGYWLPDVLNGNGKSVQIGRISREVRDEAAVVRVAYEFVDRNSPSITFKGRVDLLPDRFWVVAGWESERILNGVPRRTVLEREFVDQDGVPFVHRDRRLVTAPHCPDAASRESVAVYHWSKDRAYALCVESP
ncbi:hypothetical protein R5W24_006462, partial [Gemmata sp. JC717]|uniref:hypothetical protein n=1 Tax=Gemmata algarum TaxID=2975278 RepID=UPI0021BBADF3